MKIFEILEEVFSVKEDQCNDETVLMDLEEWDSMAHMMFITKLEEHYQIELSGDDIADMRSVGDIKKILKKMDKSDQ